MSTLRKLTKLCMPFVAALLLALTLGATRASADTITLTISNPNTGLGGVAGPYATVTITTTSTTTATVTFNSLDFGGNTFLLAGTNAVDLNVNAASFTVSGISGTNAEDGTQAFTPGPYSTSSGEVDGFGIFNLSVDSFDGFTHGATQITFTLTNTSGTWASAANVLTPNAGGSTAAIHGFACVDNEGSTSTDCTAVLVTGFAANGSQVPEPASIALFGSGLVGLAGLIRKRRKQTSAS